MKKNNFEERGFRREKGKLPLKLQGNVIGASEAKQKKSKQNKTKTTPPKQKQQVIGIQQQQKQ